MYPVLFSIKGVNFYSYGFFVSLAFLTCYFIFYFLSRKNSMSTNLLFEKMFIVLFSGVIGARIMYAILYPTYFSSIIDIFKIWEGGLVSFGGILGGFIALIIIFYKKLWQYLDIFAVSFLAAAGTWRIGCFLTGDHPSIFSANWYAINYEVPTILFELLLSYLGFLVSYFIFNHKILKSGYLFFLVFCWYGATRLLVDRWRIDDVILGLKSGQFAGLMMLLLGLIGITCLYFFKYNKINTKKG